MKSRHISLWALFPKLFDVRFWIPMNINQCFIWYYLRINSFRIRQILTNILRQSIHVCAMLNLRLAHDYLGDKFLNLHELESREKSELLYFWSTEVPRSTEKSQEIQKSTRSTEFTFPHWIICIISDNEKSFISYCSNYLIIIHKFKHIQTLVCLWFAWWRKLNSFWNSSKVFYCIWYHTHRLKDVHV